MKTFTAKENCKLSEALLSFYGPTTSYGKAMKLIENKDVKVNGKRTGKDVFLSVGDEVTAYYDGEEFKITELYSDENALVVYKPPKMTSEDFYSLVKRERPTAGFIHRLDRNTDGIMIFSLNAAAENSLKKGFKERTFEKYYLAEVYGEPKKDRETLTAYLKKDPEKSLVKIYSAPTPQAEKIITEYEVLKRSGGTSVLKVKLVTGKTHQIRAHLAYVGHFIIGDGKYGKEAVNRMFHAKRQRLTAYTLRLKFAKGDPLYYLDGREFVYLPALADYGLSVE